MRVLHLLSQTALTGAEVYAADLCRYQMENGDSCLIVSDTLSVPTDAEYIPMPIDNRSFYSRIRNIARLVSLCRENEVDIIHAHSRAASWVANIVANICGVAYVSTVHGRQKAHFSSRRWNIYGRNVITVCEHIQDNLVNELNIPESHIRVVRNGI